jgi:hypothetical protein
MKAYNLAICTWQVYHLSDCRVQQVVAKTVKESAAFIVRVEVNQVGMWIVIKEGWWKVLGNIWEKYSCAEKYVIKCSKNTKSYSLCCSYWCCFFLHGASAHFSTMASLLPWSQDSF